MSDIFNHEADAWDSLNDGYDEPINPSPKKFSCKRCGKSGLQWKLTTVGWRTHIFDVKELRLKQHICNAD